MFVIFFLKGIMIEISGQLTNDCILFKLVY
jgi:hypothetical protein